MHHPSHGPSAALRVVTDRIHRRASVYITTGVCVAAIIGQLFFGAPDNGLSWAAFAADCILTAIIPFSPLPACVAIFALHVLLSVAPIPLTWAFVTIFPVIGYISYVSKRIRWPVLIVLVATAAEIISNFINHEPQPVSDGLSYLIPYGMTALVCSLIRINADQRLNQEKMAFDEQRRRDQLARIEHNQQLATAIHDSVTRELSSVAMLAWQWEHEPSATDDVRAAMGTIRAEAQSALNHVHDVIDLIAEMDADEPQPASADKAQQLRDVIRVEDEAAKSLGYDGVSLIRGDDGILRSQPLPRRQLIADVVKELYANIIRHAQPGPDAYTLVVKCTADMVAISQTNSVAQASEADGPLSGVRHGRGIQSHADAITQIGGTVRSSQEDGQWYFHAEIPLNTAENI